MSIKYMSDVMQHSPHRGTTKLCLLAIADKADQDGFAWPSNGYLAYVCNTTARSVQRIVDGLITDGWLHVIERGGRGPRDTRKIQIRVTQRSSMTSTSSTTSSVAKGDTGVAKRVTPTSPDTSKDTADTSLPSQGLSSLAVGNGKPTAIPDTFLPQRSGKADRKVELDEKLLKWCADVAPHIDPHRFKKFFDAETADGYDYKQPRRAFKNWMRREERNWKRSDYKLIAPSNGGYFPAGRVNIDELSDHKPLMGH